MALRRAHGPAWGLDTDLYLSQAEQTQWDRAIAAARTQLSEARARCVWDEGQAMTVEEAVHYAVGETGKV